VLKAEKFPACITNLDTGLSYVDWNDLSHCKVIEECF
jgi:hypothetical protein